MFFCIEYLFLFFQLHRHQHHIIFLFLLSPIFQVLFPFVLFGVLVSWWHFCFSPRKHQSSNFHKVLSISIFAFPCSISQIELLHCKNTNNHIVFTFSTEHVFRPFVFILFFLVVKFSDAKKPVVCNIHKNRFMVWI